MTLPDAACPACGARAWTRLPELGPPSVASDWRVLREPLRTAACASCALSARAPSALATGTLYESGYALYAHAPGDPRERARQAQYAAWIAAAIPSPPRRLIDIGCGNGSLLLALREQWPAAALLGCDPSPEAVAHGVAAGLDLRTGTSTTLPSGLDVDVAVTVNVIEHTPDPVRFLHDVARALSAGGAAVIVCPDGSRPDVELLFADHLWSFAPQHLASMSRQAGLQIVAATRAPEGLGSFQMAVVRPGPGETPGTWPAADALLAAKRRYLDRWRTLDATLLARLGIGAQNDVVCFGTGEAAGLLRAYTPRTWERVRACTADAAVGGRFGELPVIPLDAVAPSETLLLGVRPADQPSVERRLRGRFARVVTWYDSIDG